MDANISISEVVKIGVSLDIILTWMTRNGSSLILNWGEDDNLWECSWIVGGDRYTTFNKTARSAARECINKVAKERLKIVLDLGRDR